ncbi:hypothetical protein [Wielerella bovis]|nr:hypothetical protein [Wielerella bovis]ULJ67514.1 hypothetical protein MIS31_02860 [Wielerella bovis]
MNKAAKRRRHLWHETQKRRAKQFSGCLKKQSDTSLYCVKLLPANV